MNSELPNTLKSVPQPLLSDLVRGRWLPVVGAGLSMNANVSGTGAMPNWRSLGDRIGRHLPREYAADSNPLETLSAYQYAFGRSKLVEAVQQELHLIDARPGPIHDAFCKLPFEVVVTTNVEQLLEQQYRIRYGSVLSVIEEEQLRIPNPYPSPIVVKFHGDLHHPSSLILTEADYDGFLDQHPLFATWLANQLISKTGVLIGYSLDDPDFRAVLAQIHARLGNVPPDLYVLDVDADPVRVDRYQRRGVRVVNIPSGDRGWDILEDLFKDLAEYWASQVPERVTSSTTIGRMVVRARTRLDRVVLFLVSGAHLSDYDENVFFDLIEQGLFPITEEDIQRQQGNELAGLDLLLRAANQVVVEVERIDDPRLQRAVRAIGIERILIVLPPTQILSASDYRWHLEWPATPNDWEDFSARLLEMLQQQRNVLIEEHLGTIGNIRQLLDAGQVQMAFLSGVVELEGSLNRLMLDQPEELIDRPEKRYRGRPWSLRDLLTVAQRSGLLELTDGEILELTIARNNIVHGRQLPIDGLQRLVELVLRLLEGLPPPTAAA